MGESQIFVEAEYADRVHCLKCVKCIVHMFIAERKITSTGKADLGFSVWQLRFSGVGQMQSFRGNLCFVFYQFLDRSCIVGSFTNY